MRLRITAAAWPEPGLEIGDSPRPGCEWCDGAGGTYEDIPTVPSLPARRELFLCGCWDSDRRLLLRLPGWACRLFLGYRPLDDNAPF